MIRSIPARPATAVGGVVAAALFACGACTGHAGSPASSESSTAPTPTARATGSVAPATGARVLGDDYTFRVPAGWRDYTKQLDDDRVDRAAASTRGSRSSVNVILTDQSITNGQIDAVLQTIRGEILPTAPTYEVLPERTVAGARAGHLAGLRTQDGAKYWLEQFVFGHGAHTYIVSFSFSPMVRERVRSRTIDSILATWRWR